MGGDGRIDVDLPRDYPTLTETLRILDSLAGVDRAQWNALAAGNPTLAWEFLTDHGR